MWARQGSRVAATRVAVLVVVTASVTGCSNTPDRERAAPRHAASTTTTAARTSGDSIVTTTVVASGETFADALAGGADAAARGAPLLLTTRDNLPGATYAFLDDQGTAINRVTVYGGTAAVGDVPAYFALLAFG